VDTEEGFVRGGGQREGVKLPATVSEAREANPLTGAVLKVGRLAYHKVCHAFKQNKSITKLFLKFRDFFDYILNFL